MLPFLGVFLYLLMHGSTMAERKGADERARLDAQLAQNRSTANRWQLNCRSCPPFMNPEV